MTKRRTRPGAAGRSIAALASGFGAVLPGLMSVAGAAWGSPLAAQTPGTIFRDCGVCPEMVVVPPGRSVMGSPESEPGRRGTEGPQGILSIGYSFAVGVYEVTFDEWDECARAGGCGGYLPEDDRAGRGRRPVIFVNWPHAQAYVEWLSQRTGERYRLLSEAEWEYVARAGTRTARYWGESEADQCRYANGAASAAVSCSDGYGKTAPVGSFEPNAFGLYDVLGNVHEWVEDCSNYDHDGAPMDGSARHHVGCSRVLRGGSAYDVPNDLRSATRFIFPPRWGRYDIGFRVARTIN